MQLRKSFPVCLVLFFFTFTVICQDTKLSWGPEYKGSKKTVFNGFIGQQDKFTYALSRHENDGYFIDKYDQNLAFVSSTPIGITGIDADDFYVQNIFLLKDEFIFCYTSYSTKENLHKAFINKVSLNGSVTGKANCVATLRAKKSFNTGKYHFSISENDAKLVLQYIPPEFNDYKENFGLKVFDVQNLKLEWEREIILPVKDKEASFSDLTINNDGKVYLLTRYENGKEIKKGKTPEYNFHIYAMNGSDKQEDFSVKLKTNYISAVTFRVNKKQDIICTGQYNTENDGRLVSGVFYLELDGKTTKVKMENQKKLSDEYIANHVKKNKADEANFVGVHSIRDMIVKQDGSIYMIGEFFLSSENQSTGSNGQTSTIYELIYTNIMVARFSPDGTVNWVTDIPKKQVSRNEGGAYSSYTYLFSGNKLYFLYNGLPANISQTHYRKLKQHHHSDARLVLATVDVNGKLTRELLAVKGSEDLHISPTKSLRTSDNTLILYAPEKASAPILMSDFNSSISSIHMWPFIGIDLKKYQLGRITLN